MKILHVIASMDPASGGTSQGIRNSIPELEKIGVQNEVVCLDGPSASFLKTDDFIIHAIGPSRGPWQSSPNLIPWLIDNFARFDAVIINGLWLYHGFAVRKALDKYKALRKSDNSNLKIPGIYVMPHGMLDPYFQKAGGRKLKAIRNWLYWRLIENKVVNNAEAILFTSEAELELARQPFAPYAPKDERNVGYGIPPTPTFSEEMKDAFQASCLQLKNRNYFLFISRIHAKKGVDILIDAYKAVLAAYPEIPCLVIAGPGLETIYGKQLLNIVENDQQLTTRVFFPGMLTGSAKWGAFYGCEAFVLPSHQENFGIAVVEALACAKPVLISDQVNIWKEIEAAGGGFVESDNLEGTKKLLERFLSLEKHDKKIMSSSAGACYQNNFTIKVAASKFSKALKR